MKYRGVAVKLFIFAAFTGAVTIMLASVIGNYALLKNRYSLEAVFDDVTGLLNNDPVTLAGVTIGKVTEQRVERGLAIVKLSIDKDVRLPATSRIEIRYRNLIGLRVVNIDPGTGAPPYIPENGRISRDHTQGPLDLDAVLNSLRPLLTGLNPSDINTISRAIVVSFARHKDDIDAVLADTATFLNTLGGRGVELGRLIDNLATVSTSVAGEREQLSKLLSSFATVAETLAGNAGPLDRTLTNLNTATGELGRLIQDNRSSLRRDLDDLATVLRLVLRHQADLVQITNHLDDQLSSTLRALSYGEWGNLYVPALCLLELTPGCDNASSASVEPRGFGALFTGAAEGRP